MFLMSQIINWDSTLNKINFCIEEISRGYVYLLNNDSYEVFLRGLHINNVSWTAVVQVRMFYPPQRLERRVKGSTIALLYPEGLCKIKPSPFVFSLPLRALLNSSIVYKPVAFLNTINPINSPIH